MIRGDVIQCNMHNFETISEDYEKNMKIDYFYNN